jgi:hypothetical protein
VRSLARSVSPCAGPSLLVRLGHATGSFGFAVTLRPPTHGTAAIEREVGPDPPWVGVGGTLDRGRAPLGGASTAYGGLCA